MLPTSLVLSLLFIVIPSTHSSQHPLFQLNTPRPVKLHLRHVHVASASGVLFADVTPELSSQQAADSDVQIAYTLDTIAQRTHRPSSLAAHAQARVDSMLRSAGRHNGSDAAGVLSWEEDVIVAPDVTSRETLLMLAKMTSNAYIYPEETGWYDLDGEWNVSYPFGWEETADGLRGHIFVSADNKTVAVSVKGTSAPFFGGGGPTMANDKLNNNLLFSCCCAYVGFSWTPVCGCPAGGWKCDRNCVEASLLTDHSFYPVSTNLYNNISYMYPEANIWLIGHSLGGALASLLGITFGAPVVAFESPGDKMAAARLHLPSPPSTQHVTHVYHTADPVPMGTCTGVFSSCALAGFALESRCHIGKTVLYDTVTKLGWSVSITSHQIKTVIDLLAEEHDWDSISDGEDELVAGRWSNDLQAEQKEQKGKGRGRKETDGNVGKMHRAVPIAAPEEDCIECYKWEYGDFLDPGNW